MLYPLSYEGRGPEGYRSADDQAAGRSMRRTVCNTDPR